MSTPYKCKACGLGTSHSGKGMLFGFMWECPSCGCRETVEVTPQPKFKKQGPPTRCVLCGAWLACEHSKPVQPFCPPTRCSICSICGTPGFNCEHLRYPSPADIVEARLAREYGDLRKQLETERAQNIANLCLKETALANAIEELAETKSKLADARNKNLGLDRVNKELYDERTRLTEHIRCFTRVPKKVVIDALEDWFNKAMSPRDLMFAVVKGRPLVAAIAGFVRHSGEDQHKSTVTFAPVGSNYHHRQDHLEVPLHEIDWLAPVSAVVDAINPSR